MYENYEMYIHRAYGPGQKVNTWSAGCQTMKLTDFEEFKKILANAAKANQKTFTYLLLNNW